MENSLGNSFMAVFVVSGSVVLLAMQLHKRLLSDFMKKMEFEIGPAPTGGCGKNQVRKKKVRFSNDVVELSSNSIPCRNPDESLEVMPENWQVLYKGILKNRNVKACN